MGLFRKPRPRGDSSECRFRGVPFFWMDWSVTPPQPFRSGGGKVPAECHAVMAEWLIAEGHRRGFEMSVAEALSAMFGKHER